MDNSTNATKSGFKTSEFLLSLATIFGTVLLPTLDTTVNSSVVALGAHGTIGMIVAGAVAGAYSIGRSIVKAASVSQPSTTAPVAVVTQNAPSAN